MGRDSFYLCVFVSKNSVFDNTNGTHNEFFCHMKLTCSEWKLLHPAMDTFVFVQSSMLCFPSNLEAQAVTVPRHPILFRFLLHLVGGDL